MGSSAIVYLNGAFVSADQAVVPVTDRGFLYGDSVFETVRAYGGHVFSGTDHFHRLAASATALGIPLPFGEDEFLATLDRLMALNNLENAMVRVTVSRGSGPAPVPDPSGCKSPTVVAMVRPASLADADWSHGIGAVVVPVQATPKAVLNPAIKSGNFLSHVMAIAHAKSHGDSDAHGGVEAILLDAKGHVAEGAVSNVFGVWNGTLNTPPDGDILPGITRKVVLDLAHTLAIPVREGVINGQDLKDADELFVTNSGWEVMPVTRLNGIPLGNGEPGPITRRLHEAYRKKVMAAC